jgi:hypothetical protein
MSRVVHFLCVLSIQIVRMPNGGKDRVSFRIEGPPQFPEGYPNAVAEVECDVSAGHAEAWLEQLGIDRELVPVEIIDARREEPRPKFSRPAT